MNNQCRPFWAEQRIWLTLLQRHSAIQHFDDKLAASWNVEIGHVTGVGPVGRHHPMFLLVGIEVSTGGHEGWLAFANAVDVESMLSRRQSFYREGNQHAGRRLGQSRAADILAVFILQRSLCALCSSREH